MRKPTWQSREAAALYSFPTCLVREAPSGTLRQGRLLRHIPADHQKRNEPGGHGGCGYGLRQLSEIAERVTGREIKEFTSIGGGAKSETWAQIKADITGKDIKILDMNDMAPIGAALLAGVGAGIFKDVYEAADKVEKKYISYPKQPGT